MSWLGPPQVSGAKSTDATLTKAHVRLTQRTAEFSAKISLVNNQLRALRDQIVVTVDATRARSLRQRAATLMRQRTLYEQNRDRAEAQARNIEQQRLTIDSLADTRLTADAMRSAHTAMQQQTRQVSVDDVAETLDSMHILMTEHAELEDALAEPFGGAGGEYSPIDEATIDAELNALTTHPPPPTDQFVASSSQTQVLPAVPSTVPQSSSSQTSSKTHQRLELPM